MTKVQGQALGVVQSSEPVTNAEVARHLMIDYSLARSAMNALERRNYVARQYSGRGYSAKGFGWTITSEGAVALAAWLTEHPDEVE